METSDQDPWLVPTLKTPAVRAQVQPSDQDIALRETAKNPVLRPSKRPPDRNAEALPVAGQIGARNEDIPFIALLRGVACLLVVWDHLAGIWLDASGKTWLPLTLVRNYVTTPLDIIQDFGFFGVVLFFFVSGFIITHVAQRESHLAFVIKRVFRIYPPLILSILAIYATDRIYLHFTGVLLGSEAKVSVHNLLVAMTLTNYFMVPQAVVNGVAWTLVIEVIFYGIVLCLLPLMKKAPRLAAPLASLVCFIVIWNIKSFGAGFFLFGISVSYIPLLLIGQATYFLWTRRIKWYEFAGIIAVDYYLFVHVVRNVNTAFYPPANSYGVSVAYAYGVFVICLLLNHRMRVPKIISFYSKMSYSLYLFHGFIGFLILRIVTPYTGFSTLGYAIAMAAAFAVGTAVTYVVYRLVERPSQRFARILVKRIDRWTATVMALFTPRGQLRTR